jgi:hypothetical protein
MPCGIFVVTPIENQPLSRKWRDNEKIDLKGLAMRKKC